MSVQPENGQMVLFETTEGLGEKTYRAIRHDVVRQNQNQNKEAVHHPRQKTGQIKKILGSAGNLKILEMFAGRGNLTCLYKKYGEIEAYDQKWLKTGDSYLRFHRLISEKRKYDVVDLDPYGFPSRFFPDVFLLVDYGHIFITFPKPFVNILNGITQTHLTAYYGEPNPKLESIQKRVALYGLCHWREVVFEDVVDLGRLWRFAIKIKKVKATDYTGVNNR